MLGTSATEAAARCQTWQSLYRTRAKPCSSTATLGQEDGKEKIEKTLEDGNVMHYPTA